ncbi:MAG: serine hydrolase [Verrucomicrobia bacterium]|nr:serine hydrolase [Verrucomicrobiota bacterium]
MKSFFRVLLCFTTCLCIAGPATGQELPLAKPEAVGMSAEGMAKITSTIQKFIDDKEIGGAVTIVARRGKVIHFEAQGMQDISANKPMAKDTIFRIYSMTKAVVSVGAMILVEEGKLELDVPASRYIPALGKMKVGGKPQEREMTLRDLLRHTAGFPNNVTTDRALRKAGHPSLAKSTLEEMMNRLEAVPLRYQPGKGWHYSFATDVVARLVEVGAGQTVDKFLEARVFKPLGMVDTAFYCPKEKWDRFVTVYGRGLKPTIGPQPGTTGPFTFEKAPKFLSGGGGLVSTAGDYMRFCLMLSGKGEFAGKRLLKAETVEAMTRNQIPEGVGEITRRPEGRGFGLGFAVRTRKIDGNPSPLGEYEWLGGAGTEFFLSPSEELAVITLSQQSPMTSLKNAVRPAVFDAILKKGTTSKTTPKRNRFLLLDSRVVEHVDNARLMPGTIKKSPHNPLLVEDKPWEPRYDNMYPNVIYDEEEKLYKCWYSPFIVDERTSETPPPKRNPESTHYMSKKPNRREEALLYATSKDGLHWEKPELGIVEFQGSRKNNIACHGLSGAGVIKDKRDPKPERRYKAFYCSSSGYKMRYSADGLHWSSEVALPGVGESDTHANMIWSPELNKYVGILRHYDRVPITGNRKVARTESADAVKWSKSTTILEGTPLKQLHDMTIFRDGSVYLGLLGCMHYPSRKSRDGVRQHVELAWSPDSYTWHRISPGTPLIAPTDAKERVFGKMPYDWGNSFAAQPIIRAGEIQIYYGASDWYFFDWRKGSLALATLRKDGWAGYEPVDQRKPAVIRTTSLARTTGKLRLCADVAPGGSIRVILMDGDNKEFIASKPLTKTVTDGEVQWANDFSLDQIESDEFRLGFEIVNAKLYSFSFAD